MKKLYISLLLIITCSLVYIFLNSNDRNKNHPDVRIEESHINVPQLNHKATKPIDNALITNNFESIAKQNKMSAICDFGEPTSIKYFSKTILNRNQTIDNLSAKQKYALNKIYDNCIQWYDYFHNLTNPEKELIQDRRKNFLKSNDWYNSKVDFNKRLESAKNSLSDDPEGMGFSALFFLLQNDLQLIQEISKRLQTKDWSLIKSSRMHVATLYGCINKPEECSRYSTNMLTLCIDDEQYCNMNYSQYLAAIYSSNQFFDIENIVDHLRDIIDKGYPDQAVNSMRQE